MEIPDVVPETPVCDVGVYRGACPPCRFSRCLNVGMRDSMVLTDDDRTKKYINSHVTPK